MGVKFFWKEEYSVGDGELDRQHREIIALANEMEGAKVSQSKVYILQLYKHTREHFAAEEKHMREIGFPEILPHIEMHTKLLLDLNKITEKPLTTEEDFTNFKQFIYEWVMDHFLVRDKKYFDYHKAHK